MIEARVADMVDADRLAPVYAAAFAAPPHDEPDASALRAHLPAHSARERFTLVEAWSEGRVVGFAYGYTGRPGQWWSDRIAAALGARPASALVGGHFEVVHLAVEPAAQGRGTGTALLETLLHERPEPRAMLETHDGPTAAMRLYLRHGFRRLVTLPDGVALVKDLP